MSSIQSFHYGTDLDIYLSLMGMAKIPDRRDKKIKIITASLCKDEAAVLLQPKRRESSTS